MTTIGEHLRDAGIADNLAAETGALFDYRDHVEMILADLVRRRVEFTADDVHKRVPDGVTPRSHNTLPSLIRTWANRGRIEAIGWARSNRPSRHASVNRVWRAA